ncbi:MAG: DUF2520 domain-containing protein [Bacteroidetes bacterium]|nr:DUF2520 domain-containing protein [Bacteroidota bacterium]
MILKFGIVGSGNLASHLAKRMTECGYSIDFIHSRNQKTGRTISKACKSRFVTELPVADARSFLLFICTNDTSIQGLFKEYESKGYYLIHCSGMLPLLKSKKTLTGVFYPVQTFASKLEVDWSKITICVESKNSKLEKLLKILAKKLSGKVMLLSSKKRAHLHLAAVFANNFVNANYTMAMDLLKSQHIPYSLLEGLILQTAKNATKLKPMEVQTGPAKRHDMQTIKAHKLLLKGKLKERKMYDLMTAYLLGRKG